MLAETLTFRTTAEADWRALRTLRLEMLADTPIAFGETVADALAADEQNWRERARRTASPENIGIAAIDDASGRWVGMMRGYVDRASAPTPMLVGVYVTPEFRGPAFGVADRLLAGIEEWAAGHGGMLTLQVHEDNERAIAFYRRRGYELTGETAPYELDPKRVHLVMRKALHADA